jgi:tetratricopeptide (TPR) repeat protein
MAEISLRDYFAKLDQLLTATAADEVIHHCRHILQYYPKNVAAYRYLGRALLINGRWDEAQAALRRVLSVIPDDYHAHLGLSEIYDHKQRPDEAIWYLERAFEHHPNNRELLEALRALYRRYRDVEQAKIQLTAAAVARQAQRNQAYEQAIETLRDALVRQADRIDLRVLLSSILWERGDHVEAAETALDVLQTLPDCLEANRILTALWLEEERPSDARRYLNRVEAIDPYLAVELAQGQSAADSAFRLEELDYKRTAHSAVVDERPAWLEGITSDGTPETVGPSDADRSHFTSSMLAGSMSHATNPEGEPTGEPTGDLFGEAWMDQEHSAAQSSVEDEIPDEFALFALPSAEDNQMVLPPADSGSSSPFEPDPLTWLRASGVELSEEPAQNGISHAEDVLPREADSLEWMQDDEYEGQARPQPSADAFSWMQQFDVEWVEDQTELDAGEPAAEAPVPPAEGTPGWLQNDSSLEEALGIEQLTQNDQSAALTWLNQEADWNDEQEAAGALEPEQTAFNAAAPAAEIPDLFGDTEAAEVSGSGSVSEGDTQGVPGPRRGLTAMLNEANFDWMKKEESQEDIMSDAVMDEWLAHFGASPSQSAAAAQEPEWLNELDTVMNENENKQHNSDETPNWLPGDDDHEAPQTPAEEEALAWLNQTAAEAAPEPAEMPDWMAALEPSDANVAPEDPESEPLAPAEEFDWSATQPTPSEDPVESAQVPGWLTDLTPTNTYEVGTGFLSEQGETSESEFEWLGEDHAASEGATADAGSYTWLDEAEAIEAEAEEAALEDQVPAQEESPTWLSGLGVAEQAQPQTEPAAELPDDSWYDELEIEAEAAQDADEGSRTPAAPDWLTGLQIGKRADPAEPAAAASFDWLDAVEDEAPADAAEQSGKPVSAELPDWLTELAIAQSVEAEPDSEPLESAAEPPGWLSQDIGQSVYQTPGGSVPTESRDYSWLNAAQPEEEAEPTAAPLPADSGDYAWLSELQSEDEPEREAGEPVGSNVPSTEPEAESSPEPVTAEEDEEFSWLNDIQPQPESAEEAIAAEAGEAGWLEALAAQPESELAQEPAAAAVGDMGWLDELTDENELELEAAAGEPQASDEVNIEAEAESNDQWLSAIASAPVVEPALADMGEPEWLAELESEQEVEAEAAELEAELEAETPDEDAVPSYLLQDTADDEDEYWLNDEQEPVAEPTSEQTWDDAINEPDGETVLATSEFDSEDEEGFEPAPASNAPDWLNAMVPGLDMNYETLEEEPTETVSEDFGEEAEDAREYDWVENIVEEESRQPPRRRFIFSRAPAWLRRSSQPAKRDDELPDWPSDEPEWQR